MTRYEMAQIVAKAMAKGANVDKLAAEFADELDALGVRVAALEKKADNVKITGQIRWNYASIRRNNGRPNDSTHQLRTRLLFTGKVNDTWNYVTMLENRSDKSTYTGDEGTTTQRAYLDGRLGGTKVMAGRWNLTRTPNGDIYDNRVDGIKVAYGDKIKLEGYYAKTATINWRRGSNGTAPMGTNAYGDSIVGGGRGYVWGVNAAGQLGKNVKLYAGYDKFNDKDVADADDGIFDVGLTAKLGDFTLDAVYLKASTDLIYVATGEKLKDSGFVATVGYKGANFKKAGSWGLEAKYYDQGRATYVSHTMNGTMPVANGFKGYKVAAYYTVAKGMMAGIEYYDLKGKDNDNKVRTLWTELQVRF